MILRVFHPLEDKGGHDTATVHFQTSSQAELWAVLFSIVGRG